MRISLDIIHARALSRPKGYLEEVLSAGTVIGNSLEISAEALRVLKTKYRAPQTEQTGGGCGCCKQVS